MRSADRLACPHCGHLRSHVVNVRHEEPVDLRLVESYRRRQCLSCLQKFTTLATERIVGAYKTIHFSLKLSAIDSRDIPST